MPYARGGAGSSAGVTLGTPIAKSAKCPATATAPPLEEPPGIIFGFAGFFGRECTREEQTTGISDHC